MDAFALEKELQALNPMPNDDSLSSDVCSRYERVVNSIAERTDAKFVSPLIELFGYGEGFGIYWNAIHCLERLSQNEVDPLLIGALSSDKPGVRMWSALMLGRSHNHLAISFIKELLNDEFEFVRRNAVIALEMIAGADILTDIQKMIDDPSVEVRNEVTRVLNKFQA